MNSLYQSGVCIQHPLMIPAPAVLQIPVPTVYDKYCSPLKVFSRHCLYACHHGIGNIRANTYDQSAQENISSLHSFQENNFVNRLFAPARLPCQLYLFWMKQSQDNSQNRIPVSLFLYCPNLFSYWNMNFLMPEPKCFLYMAKQDQWHPLPSNDPLNGKEDYIDAMDGYDNPCSPFFLRFQV